MNPYYLHMLPSYLSLSGQSTEASGCQTAMSTRQPLESLTMPVVRSPRIGRVDPAVDGSGTATGTARPATGGA